MEINDKIFEYCKQKYSKEYASKKKMLENEVFKKSHRGNLTDNQKKKIETASQLHAIKASIIDGRKLYPNNIPELWANIYKAHLYRKSGIFDPKLVEKAIKAEQSWRSSSGHAFEEMVKDLGTLAMEGTGIQYILQKDLNILLKANELANGPTDIAWLKQQVKGAVFDVYVIAEVKVLDEETNEIKTMPKCFGCVQCKTSIRDRVSRDREPSVEAMKSQFWSIAFVLDGTMINVPKYKNMVNGNEESEFKKNGWHGVYVLSENESEDRIYGVDLNFNIIREHTLNAFNTWKSDRQGYTRDWRADSLPNRH